MLNYYLERGRKSGDRTVVTREAVETDGTMDQTLPLNSPPSKNVTQESTVDGKTTRTSPTPGKRRAAKANGPKPETPSPVASARTMQRQRPSRVVSLDMSVVEDDMGRLSVGDTTPGGPASKRDSIPRPAFETIGGLAKQIEQVRDLVELPLRQRHLYDHFGLRPPGGILLYGAPGTGKTLLLQAISESLNRPQENGAALRPVSIHSLSGSELFKKYMGESEQVVRAAFERARADAPSVLLIDEIDVICPSRLDDGAGDAEKRVVATFLEEMDGVGGEVGQVIVIAATNHPNALDPALRRPGRLDHEIEIPIPDSEARSAILRILLRNTPLSREAETKLDEIAAKAHGYVGADLAAVVRVAGLRAIKRVQSGAVALELAKVESNDLDLALSQIRPSAMRDVYIETPKVLWSDIGGAEGSDVRQRLREAVEWPLKYPESYKRLGINPPRGLLLYGPPGCSKTLTAKALATESGLNFLAVKGPELLNKYVGESERAIRQIFKKARAAAPSIIFFDEIDAIASRRGEDDGHVGGRMLASLLNEMDGIEELVGVMILAATNRPNVIVSREKFSLEPYSSCQDDALLRPGRLDRLLYVGLPGLEARGDIFRIQSGKMAFAEDVDVNELAEIVSALTKPRTGTDENRRKGILAPNWSQSVKVPVYRPCTSHLRRKRLSDDT